MTKLTRFVGTCLLLVSTATVALAGETLGAGLPSPPPPAECTENCTPNETTLLQPDASVTADVVNVIVIWLVESIR